MDIDTVLKWMAGVALALAIACMCVFLVLFARVNGLVSRLQEPPPAQEECWDPGGGTVCAPSGEGLR